MTDATASLGYRTTSDGRGVIVHGDFRTLLPHGVADIAGQVDVVLTDPPYLKQYLSVWGDLARVSEQLLKPGGVLLALSGQLYLDFIIPEMAKHLKYGWIFNMVIPGANTMVKARGVRNGWKPWLAFYKGSWPTDKMRGITDQLDERVGIGDGFVRLGQLGSDVILAPKVNDSASYHKWGQSTAPAVHLLEQFCPADGLVVDPMLGGGSYGVAALSAGHRFVGCEVDPEAFETSCSRLEAT